MTFDFVAAGGDGLFIDKLARWLNVELVNGALTLPLRIGTGYVKALEPNRGLTILLFRVQLQEELIIRRQTAPQPNNVLILTFYNLPLPDARPQDRPESTAWLPSVQITSNDLAFDTVLQAGREQYAVALAVHTDFLRGVLNLDASHSVLQTILSQKQPYFYDELISPEITAVTANLLTTNVPAELHDLYYSLQAQQLLYLLFVELLKREKATSHLLNLADVKTIYQIRDKLLGTLHEPPLMSELIRLAGMSESKLQRLFKQIFGSSLYTYYQSFRMQEAAHLLQKQRLSVAEVGYQLGFSNLSHFARLFEKHLGITPKKYAMKH